MFIYHSLFTLVLKSPNGEWPITCTFTFTIIYFFKKMQTSKICEMWEITSVIRISGDAGVLCKVFKGGSNSCTFKLKAQELQIVRLLVQYA